MSPEVVVDEVTKVSEEDTHEVSCVGVFGRRIWFFKLRFRQTRVKTTGFDSNWSESEDEKSDTTETATNETILR